MLKDNEENKIAVQPKNLHIFQLNFIFVFIFYFNKNSNLQ